MPGDDRNKKTAGNDNKKGSPGMTCTAGARRIESIVLKRPRCSGGSCEEHKGTVILGLDPRIHVNKLALCSTWIAGSSPAMTIKKRGRG